MFRHIVSLSLIVLLGGCSLHPTPQTSRVYRPEPAQNETPSQSVKDNAPSPSAKSGSHAEGLPAKPFVLPVSVQDKGELPKVQQPSPVTKEPPASTLSVSTLKDVPVNAPKQGQPLKEDAVKKSAASTEKERTTKNPPTKDQAPPKVNVAPDADKDEVERDIMEEALALLNESHRCWLNGDLEDALESLDQAYALMLDTDGNPDIARQKDDLRLMISKRILTIYNSVQTTAKGIRSEIPLVSNADVEKEIRQFQTVEREFFISSYQRSAVYRPMILRELKKAGLPEELAWLPLVESGFKINALSSARALGLWQFIPSTGYKYGLSRDEWVDERMDMEKSTLAAIEYLKELHKMFGDWLTVLAAYNCGEGRVMRTISRQHINYLDQFWDLYHQLPFETARYVPRFLATVMVIKDPQKYGIDLGPVKTAPLAYETAEIKKSVKLQDIAQKLDVPEDTLNILNAELRHKVTPDKPYKLRVPTDVAGLVAQVIDDIAPAEKPRESLAPKRGAVIKHQVKKGETLASLARKYKTSLGAIKSANHIPKSGKLAVGQRLNIPVLRSGTATYKIDKTETCTIHKVQKGDTLASIAKKYDISAAEVKKANQLKSDKLKIGQDLRIENGKVGASSGNQKEKGAENKGTPKPETKKAPAAGKTADLPAVKKYTVKKGDSLNKIARENNISLEQLRKLNSLAHRDNIRPGQVIQLR